MAKPVNEFDIYMSIIEEVIGSFADDPVPGLEQEAIEQLKFTWEEKLKETKAVIPGKCTTISGKSPPCNLTLPNKVKSPPIPMMQALINIRIPTPQVSSMSSANRSMINPVSTNQPRVPAPTLFRNVAPQTVSGAQSRSTPGTMQPLGNKSQSGVRFVQPPQLSNSSQMNFQSQQLSNSSQMNFQSQQLSNSSRMNFQGINQNFPPAQMYHSTQNGQSRAPIQQHTNYQPRPIQMTNRVSNPQNFNLQPRMISIPNQVPQTYYHQMAPHPAQSQINQRMYVPRAPQYTPAPVNNGLLNLRFPTAVGGEVKQISQSYEYPNNLMVNNMAVNQEINYGYNFNNSQINRKRRLNQFDGPPDVGYLDSDDEDDFDDDNDDDDDDDEFGFGEMSLDIEKNYDEFSPSCDKSPAPADTIQASQDCADPDGDLEEIEIGEHDLDGQNPPTIEEIQEMFKCDNYIFGVCKVMGNKKGVCKLVLNGAIVSISGREHVFSSIKSDGISFC